MTARLALYEQRDEVRRALREAAERAGLVVLDLSATPDSVAAAADGATAFRAPGGLLTLAMTAGAPIVLMGPTVEWFVALGPAVTGRHWTACSAEGARALVARGPALVKLADAKHPRFPARRFASVRALDEALDEALAGFGTRPPLLATTHWLAIESEYRTFCLGRQVLTVSPYLVEDEMWSPRLHTHRASFHAEAADWLRGVLAALPADDVPPAAVLDVARLADGRFVLLEANNPWSSGLYSCDPGAVLRCVLAANGATGATGATGSTGSTGSAVDRWRWRPGPWLDRPD